MNICIVNIHENNPYIGGVERVSFELGHDWIKKGHNVFFLSQYKSTIKKSYQSLCKEFFLPNRDKADSTENVEFFIKLLKENNVDIILNQGSVFIQLCELCRLAKESTGIRVITTIHYAPLCKVTDVENSFFIKAKLGTNIRKWMIDIGLYLRYVLYKKQALLKTEKEELKRVSTFSDAMVCLSSSFLSTFQNLLGDSGTAQLIAIPNPIKQIEKSMVLKKQKSIIYVGRLEFGLKRIDRLIKIWAKTEHQFPDWEFRIVGDGGLRPFFEKMAYQMGLERIYFEGFKDPDRYYAESPIICLSSSSEGFGMVLVEALRYQCIPIAYNSFSALSDIVINNVNGYCIPAFKEKIFVKKLHHLMNNEDERNRLASNHAITLDKFAFDKISQRWLDLFEELINRR